ncbi:tape measure protein [Dysgonomonas sp. HDW5A]|uniref:tape measure protein n=1 Tax=Dysgonomonas sp. HDW5A TaxID=2714926 RepID=UPI0014093DBC|nr:tape measure protein [Dysgonomonas sp. HDW5A]QIK58806.1 tape measure protein [Dysgonomonas sp. HDW5A]
MGIMNREGALYMATGVDNSGLYSGLNQAEGRIDQFGNHISAMGDKISRLTGIGFGIAGLKAFGSETINVRGEIQMLESSFEVLLGGKGVSGFMSEMKQFAVDSPLSMNGVASSAQTLLGFGISAEKVIPTIKQIGDISMGNEERFKSLSLAFAQMSATGKLMGQDLLQMINAGFNPLMTISEKTGKSIGNLKKEMENGSISSEMVADAFASATAEGGKFYGMTQKQAEGIKGLQAQLDGGLQDAFNEIGKSQEGLIAGGYKVATVLVENYKTVGEALTALIATYGLYKAAMVFNTSIDKTVTVMRYEAEIAELTKLLPLKEQEANADLKAAVASGKLTEGKAQQLIALRAEIESRRESIQSKLAEEQANLKALYAKRAEAKETLEIARAKTVAAKEELSNAIATAQADVAAKQQKSLATAQESAALTRRNAILLNSQKIQLQQSISDTIAQAEIAKKNTLLLTQQQIQAKQAVLDAQELGIKGEKLAVLKAEVAALNAKVNAAQREEAAAVKSIATKRAEIVTIDQKLVSAKAEALAAQGNVVAKKAEIAAGTQSVTTKQIESLTNKVNTLSEQENSAAVTHNGLIKQTVRGKILIKKIATDADTASTQINTVVANANTASTNMLAAAKMRLITVAKNLWAVIAPNPYVLAAAAAVALGYGIYKLATATSVQELAQESLNKVMEQASKKKDELSGKTSELVGTVNSETKTIFDQISAYKQLQGLYPNLLKNMDIQTFKALGATEQQKLLNAAINEFDFTNQEAKLIELNALYDKLMAAQRSGNASLASSIRSQIGDALDMSFWDKYTRSSNNILDILNRTISGLEKEKKQRQDNLKEAELQAKPEAERNKLLQDQLQVLKEQEASILESILKTGEYKRNIDGTISPISDVEKKFNSINELLDNWNKNPFAIKNAFASADPVLNELLTKMRLLNEEKKKLTGQLGSAIIPVVNKSTLEKQVKDFKELEESLSPDKLKKLRAGESILTSLVNTNPEEFNKLKKLEDNYKELGETAKKAKKDLKVYEDPDKAAKAAETANNKAETAAEKAAKKAQSIADQEEKIADIKTKQTLENRRKQEDLENQLTQSYISNLSEGAEKIRYQRELDSYLEIQSLERSKEDYIQAYIQAEREKFDAAEDLKAKQNSKYLKKKFDSSSISVDTSSYDTIINNKRNNQAFVQMEAEKKAWNEHLIQFGTYQEKRKAIIEKYDKEIDQALTKGDAATLEKQKQNQLDELDNSIRNSATLMGQLFADASRKSVNEMQAIIEKADLLLQYLEAVKDEQGNATIGGKNVSKNDILGLGITENTLNNLSQSTQEVESLRNAIKQLKGELGGKSAFKLFEIQVKDAINLINGGSLSQGISGIGSAVSQFSPAVSQFGQDLGNIVGNDDLGNKISGIADAIGGLGQTAQGVGQIMSGDVIGGTMAVVSGISKVVDALDGLFGADYSKFNAMKEQYDSLNEVWDQLIDKKKEYLSMAYGEEAKRVGKEAEDLVNKSIESYRLLGKEYLNSGASAGSHSKGVRQRERMNSEGWEQLQQWANNNDISESLYGSVSGGRMTGLFDLTSEQLQKLKEDAPTFWAKLSDETKEYLNNIIDGAEKIEDINKSIKEQLTQVSFDSVFDDFIDTLMDMDSSSKDFADNFANYLQKAILSSLVADKYREKLQSWYDNFAKANEEDGINAKEYADLQAEYNKIVEDALKERDALKDLLDWTGSDSSSSQSASKGGYETMSQDTGKALEGRFTAIQMSMINVEGYILTLLNINTDSNNTLKAFASNFQEIRNIVLDMMYNIQDINKNTKELYTMNEKLGRIENSLSQL